MSFEPPGYCPNCGDYVKKGALACDSCGSDAKTGWNEDTAYDGLDLPDEGESRDSGKSQQSKLLGTVLSVCLIALLIYVFVFR